MRAVAVAVLALAVFVIVPLGREVLRGAGLHSGPHRMAAGSFVIALSLGPGVGAWVFTLPWFLVCSLRSLRCSPQCTFTSPVSHSA